MTGLRIARGLQLDPDYVGGGTFALLAKKGAGKTYTARVMAEEFWRAKVPFVAIDPMGAMWGLRSSADGKGAGIPVAVFGGEHGDAPLERGAGALMADLVVSEGLSMILDLKGLGSRAAERQFAHDFFDRLYRTNSELVHLLVDEADLFAPQSPQSGDRPLLGITENIVRRGRNVGIGCTLITQRPAVLNKDVLTQVDGLVAMRITGYQDRQAIDDWVKGHADQETASEVKGTLAGLANGECWWWVPELDILKRVQVRETETFDSSPTRKRGAARREPKTFADVDMGAIEKRMSATIERAKAEDPKQLRKTIAELRRQLAQRPKEVEQVERVEYVEVPVLDDAHVERLEEALEAWSADASKVIAAANDIATQLAKLKHRPPTPAPVSRPAPAPGRRPQPRPEPSRPRPAATPQDGDAAPVSALGRQMLETLGAFPEGLTTVQLSALVGKKRAGGYFKNTLSALRTGGYVDGRDPVLATDAGLDHIGGPQPMLTRGEVLERWKASPRMSGLGSRMLDYLVDRHPDVVDLDELAEALPKDDGTPIERTGGYFKNTLSFLRSNGLAENAAGGVQAADALFLIPEVA